jgi:hypothetical protein
LDDLGGGSDIEDGSDGDEIDGFSDTVPQSILSPEISVVI